MGAWNTGIFGDDVACDVRAQFRREIEDGKSPTAARKAVLQVWGEVLTDADDGPIIWMALAATQLERKCLEKEVREKALAVLDAGGDVERWREAGPKDFKARKAVLSRLRARLVKSRPAAKKIVAAKAKPKKRFIESKANFPVGEVFAYRMTSGNYVLLHVVDYGGNKDIGFIPIFAVLDWRGKRLPSANAIQKIPLLTRDDEYRGPGWPMMIEIFRKKEKDLPVDRVVRLGVVRKPHTDDVNGGYYVALWAILDDNLQNLLGWN
jgi:hypothetical protein